MEEKTERRNVTMYPAQWEGVDAEAQRRGYVTARGPNTSLMLRQIVKAFLDGARCGGGDDEVCDEAK
jgi:hypothetical protein